MSADRSLLSTSTDLRRDRVEHAPPSSRSVRNRSGSMTRLIRARPFTTRPSPSTSRGRWTPKRLRRKPEGDRDRHEVLRATFPMVGHRPVVVIHGESTAVLSVIDVTTGSETDRLERVRRACEEDARRPFDLVRGPVLRLVLYRLSPAEHILLVNVHHIVFDGWSLSIFFKELATLYTAFSEGQPSPLPPLSIPFSDIAREQRQHLEGEVLNDLIAFWRKKLEGIPPHLALPYDHPLQAGMNFRGGRHLIALDHDLSRLLKDLSRGEGATLYMTLLAALAALLQRYTGQTDIVVAAPTAGRVSANTRGLIGNFINTLVLRTDVSGEPTFRELIARARRTALDAYSHQELPFNTLVSALNPERDATGASLLQVMLVLQNNPSPAMAMPGLTTEVLDVSTGRALYDLAIELWERDGRIVGWFDYDRDLFEGETIARMTEHFRRCWKRPRKIPTGPSPS